MQVSFTVDLTPNVLRFIRPVKRTGNPLGLQKGLSGFALARQCVGVMTPEAPDTDLVVAFVREGSETAFRALVARHVDLVYASAFRQVRDSGLAQEITQNVFVALARKAPRFIGVETVAGWLYRAAILEAKTTIRSELRRRRREEAAAQAVEIRQDGTSPLENLLPLLDEGLLQLNDADRLALVLRFLEEKSLREVGELLGVEEEAARKRVSRALERLSEFFRRRGFLLPVASAALLFAHTASAAPVGLASTASAAGLATGSVTTFNLWLAKLMTLTKTQTAAVCVLLAATPLTMHWRAQARAEAGLFALRGQIEQERVDASRLDREIDKARNAAMRAEADAVALENRQRELGRQLTDASARVGYHWSDEASLVRIPKDAFRKIGLEPVVNKDGDLRATVKEVLQMTDAEADTVSQALHTMVAEFRAAETAKIRQVEPTPAELHGRPASEVRTFEVGDLTDEFKRSRTNLMATLTQTLGEDRLVPFKWGMTDFIPVNDSGDRSVTSTQTIIPPSKRVTYWRVTADGGLLGKDVIFQNGDGMNMTGADPDQIVEPYRSHLADWIATAKRVRSNQRK